MLDLWKLCFVVSDANQELQVLSSTHSPGFSLNGNFRSPDSISVEELSTEP